MTSEYISKQMAGGQGPTDDVATADEQGEAIAILIAALLGQERSTSVRLRLMQGLGSALGRRLETYGDVEALGLASVLTTELLAPWDVAEAERVDEVKGPAGAGAPSSVVDALDRGTPGPRAFE